MYTPNVPQEEKVRAIAAWQAQNDWQLSFFAGETITVLDKFEGRPEYEGWNQGKIGDEVGMFPVAYTEPYKMKDFSVSEKKISQLVANLQKQCGFVKAGGIADLKKEFNDLQKELSSPSKIKSEIHPQRQSTASSASQNSTANKENQFKGVKSEDVGPQADNSTVLLRKEIEELQNKLKNQQLSEEKEKNRLNEIINTKTSEISKLDEKIKQLTDRLDRKSEDEERFRRRAVVLDEKNVKEEVLRMEELEKSLKEEKKSHQVVLSDLNRQLKASREEVAALKNQVKRQQESEKQPLQDESQEELQRVMKLLAERTKELEIAKRLIEQTAQLHLKSNNDSTNKQQSAVPLDSHGGNDSESAQQMKSKWRRKSIKSIPKAPAPPKNVKAELEKQIDDLSQSVNVLFEEKQQLLEMNTQLLGQIRSFLRAPPPNFLDFHMKDQMAKFNSLSKEFTLLKNQNETLQKKVSDQQRKIKELEKTKSSSSRSLAVTPRQEEEEDQEHIVECQTNALLSQLKQIRTTANGLGINTNKNCDPKYITSERKLSQQVDLLKQKLSESRSRELQLEIDLITTKEELNKMKIAMDVNNLIS